jgi:hypothetical protein
LPCSAWVQVTHASPHYAAFFGLSPLAVLAGGAVGQRDAELEYALVGNARKVVLAKMTEGRDEHGHRAGHERGLSCHEVGDVAGEDPDCVTGIEIPMHEMDPPRRRAIPAADVRDVADIAVDVTAGCRARSSRATLGCDDECFDVPTMYDLIADVGTFLSPVGRLDLDTSGLLLMTNDNRFAERVTNPLSHVPKTYLVKASTRLSDAQLQRLREGIDLADGPTRPAVVTRVRDSRNTPTSRSR